MKKSMLVLPLILGVALVSSCGNNDKIKCYTRDTTSGTRDGFFSTIGFSAVKESNDGLVEGVVTVDSNSDMITKINNDRNGIGYISLASLSNSGCKPLSYEGVAPSEANVLNSSYKLTRNFNYMTRAEYSDEKVGKIVEAFIAFLGTKDAKTTMKNEGGILQINNDDPTWDSISSAYPICQEDNSKVTVKFGGSTSVDSMAQALAKEFSKKCGNFVNLHNATGSGDAYKRAQGSEKDGANAIDVGFASREFKADSEPAAEGTTGKLCIDAIVPVVNTKNSIEAITAAQLKSIYDGTFLKWSEVK